MTQLNAVAHLELRGARQRHRAEFDDKRYNATRQLLASARRRLAYPGSAGRLPGVSPRRRARSPTSRWCRASRSASAASTPCAAIWNPRCSATTASLGTLELRSPELGAVLRADASRTRQGEPVKFNVFNEWRFFGFADDGRRRRSLMPLAEQEDAVRSRRATASGRASSCSNHAERHGRLVGVPLISQQLHAGAAIRA